MADAEQIESLLAEAKESQVKLPRGKKACEEAARNAIADGTGVQHLIEVFGLKAAAAKRKAKADAGDEAPGKPKKAAKTESAAAAAAAPAVTTHEPLGTWPCKAGDKPAIKEACQKLMAAARERGVKIPADDTALVGVGQTIMPLIQNDTLDADAAITQLETRYGSTEQDAKKAPSAGDVKVAANTPLVTFYREIGALYFKLGDRAKGSSFQKGGTALKECDWHITLEDCVSDKGPRKLAGIGKSGIVCIKEFLQTGTSQRLEQLRAQA